MPDDFIAKVSSLADKTDVLVTSVLEAGGAVVLEEVKTRLQTVIGKDTKTPSRSTGELASSLGLSPVKLNRKGDYDIKIGFAEPRRDGGSNAKVANVFEYGRHGQAPKPFLKPAKSASRKKCIDAMIQKLEEEIEKL
jgi:HK97 gp10 family phage protein